MTNPSNGEDQQERSVTDSIKEKLLYIDLTGEKPPQKSVSDPPERPFNPAKYREWERIALATLLVLSLIAVVIALIVSATNSNASANLYRDLAVLIGPVGTVLGFYFAKGNSSQQSWLATFHNILSLTIGSWDTSE